MQAGGGETLNAHGSHPDPVTATAGDDRSAPSPDAVAALPVGAVKRSRRRREHDRQGAHRQAVWTCAVLAAVVLLVDFVTKQLAVAMLADAEPVRLLGGAVYLVFTTNSGAAFSIGSSYTVVFPVIAMVVIGWIVWTATRLRSTTWAVALGLVLGGAMGNLVDRIFRSPGPFRGEVVDMLSLFDPYGRVWPVFNAADAALVVGVMLAVGLELTGRRRDGTRVTGAKRAATSGSTGQG